MIKFIFKILKLILGLIVVAIISIYIFSLKLNMSWDDTISYLKFIGSQILDIDYLNSIVANKDINIDNSIPVTSSNNNYYYEQLDEYGKIIYTAFENNTDNLKKENYIIDFSTTFNDLLNQSIGRYKLNKSFQSALYAFLYDHPELFYIDVTKISLNIKYVSIGQLKTYTVEIAPTETNYLHNSFKSEEDVEIAIQKLENIKNDTINKIANYNTYNKIKYVHDMLVNSIEYDTTFKGKNLYNIYGALVENKVVCEGYAKAFKYLMDGLNIECILVTGTSQNSNGEIEKHMWNYVKLNDNWYGVDVTWDDPIIIGGNSKDNIRYDYLLKGIYTFNDTHSPIGKINDNGMLFNLPTLSTENFR